MFLQTLVQLNILILATPALAGWSLAPPAHFGRVAHAAGIVWQYRGVEAPAPKAATQVLVRRAALPAVAVSRPMPANPAVFAVPCIAVLASHHPFPHAARAP